MAEFIKTIFFAGAIIGFLIGTFITTAIVLISFKIEEKRED